MSDSAWRRPYGNWHGQAILASALCSAIAIMLFAGSTHAQNITIQRPIIGVNSVATTVSVPDRGSAFLGGVGRAADSRKSFGPFRSGTSTGFSRSATSTSVHVRILDFDAIDRQILSRSSMRSRRDGGTPLRGMAKHAYERLAQRQADTITATRRGIHRVADSASRRMKPAPTRQLSNRQSSEKSRKQRADRSYRLGLRAELRGSPRVARLHFKLAAKRGSQEAATKLTTLASSPDASGVSALPPRPGNGETLR